MAIKFEMTGDVSDTASSRQKKSSVNKIIRDDKNGVPLSVPRESKGTSFVANVVNFLKDVFKVFIQVLGSSHRESLCGYAVKEAHVEQEQWLKKQIQSAINIDDNLANLSQNNRLKDLTKEDQRLVAEAGKNLKGIEMVENRDHSNTIELLNRPPRVSDSEERNNSRKI